MIVHRTCPGGPVVKNPPSNAGDGRSIPAGGAKIPHAVGQLSPRATTTEPAGSGAREPQQREARTPQRRSYPACRN